MLGCIKFIAIFVKNDKEHDHRRKNRLEQANKKVRRTQFFHIVASEAA